MNTDLIRLLPDAVANQIAAGEVIQRPASAVKELLENSVDSGATDIRLIVKDAGKSLIQVTDNGCGMTESDARMCFERHATSKINNADDLFAIRTMGFRGEALASIAAVAQVELRTKRLEDELGTQVIIEGTQFKSQTPSSCPNGSSLLIKNLFFNTPARRNFLKSDTAETAHIIEEFFRVTLVNPHIAFTCFINNKEVFHLAKANLKQRIVQLFGSNFNERLVPIGQNTDVASITGFVCKPEFAKKTRGEQYFFVNSRFIRQPYFHHAVEAAFRELIPEKHFPGYFIYIELDPATIDVNIHPTKTEVKFLNEKVIYSLLSSTVRQGLGKFSLAPSIDFDVEQSLDFRPRPEGHPIIQPQVRLNPDYNPFKPSQGAPPDPLEAARLRSNQENWDRLYKTDDLPAKVRAADDIFEGNTGENEVIENEATPGKAFQLKNQFIVTTVKSGLMVIDQQRAHERILYERFLSSLGKQEPLTQTELFPQHVKFSIRDAELLRVLMPDIRLLGFDISESMHSRETFVVSGMPVFAQDENASEILEEILENFKQNMTEVQFDKRNVLAAAFARGLSIKTGHPLKEAEINNMVDELFSCRMPESSPDGKQVISIISMDELIKRFK